MASRKSVAVKTGFKSDSAEIQAAISRADGWMNAFTNLGVLGKDKKMSSLVQPVILDMTTLDYLYQSSAIAARIVDRPVYEMGREGYKIISQDIPQELLEDFHLELEDKEVDAKFEEAYKLARLYGGAGILLGVRDGLAPEMPLDKSKIEAIDYLVVLDRWELMADSIIDKNPRSKNFGYPEFYRISSESNNVVNQRIHYSRIIRFYGVKHNRRISAFFNYWGDSVLSRAFNELRNYGISHDAIPNIIQDFTQVVLKMNNLPEILSMGNDQLLTQRLALLSMTSSIVNAMILQTGEDVEKKSSTVTGIDMLLKAVDDALLASTDMPHTILFNESAGGLGATGESEKKDWYDFVKGLQESVYRPRYLDIVDVFRSAKSSVLYGKEIDYTIEFNPLFQMNEKEQVEIRKAQADIDSIYIDKQVLDPIEVRKSRFGSGMYTSETTIDENLEPGFEEPMSEEVPAEDETAQEGEGGPVQ